MLARTLLRLAHIRSLPHTHNIIINTLGNYMGYAFAGIYIIFFVRVFQPVEFGVLTILQALSYLLANILSFGVPASIYAHIPEYLPDRKRTFDFIASNLLFLTGMSSLCLVLIGMFAAELDTRILKTGASTTTFIFALIGAQMFIWQNFVRDVLNAAGKFMHINIAINISNVLKVVIMMVLAWRGMLDIDEALIVMGIVGPIIVFTCVLFERRWIVRALSASRASAREIKFRYTMTYFLSTQIFNLATRIDLFLVSYFLTRPEVGYYGLSQRIVLAIVTSADSITQVMSPQFARVRTQIDTQRLLKHSFTYMLVPTAMFVGGIFMPSFVYDIVFGAHYTPSTFLTKILSMAYIPYSFLAAVLLFFLYTVKKPQYVLYTNVIILISVAAGNALLVPELRIYGPAASFGAAFVIAGVYLYGAFQRELRELPQDSE